MRSLALFPWLLTACGPGLAIYTDAGGTEVTDVTESDADGDADTDSDADVDADADTDPPEDHPPTLSAFSVSLSGSDGIVAFTASDPDGDLSGGEIDVKYGAEVLTYNIPSDLDSWSGGTGTINVGAVGSSGGGCSSSASLTVTGQVRDAAGNASANKSTTFSLPGGGIVLLEPDDDTSTNYEGYLAKGTEICGELSSTGNDIDGYTGDFDTLYFYPETYGTYTFTLTWSASSGDYDMYLLQWDSGISEWISAGSSFTEGTAQPESFSVYVDDQESYVLSIMGWDGPAGDYTVSVD